MEELAKLMEDNRQYNLDYKKFMHENAKYEKVDDKKNKENNYKFPV